METNTPTTHAGKAPLTGRPLFELAQAVAGAIFWQTGVTFADLCNRDRRHDNARAVFCGMLKWKGAKAEDIAPILQQRVTKVKALFAYYREQSENPLFDEYSRKIRRFFYGFND